MERAPELRDRRRGWWLGLMLLIVAAAGTWGLTHFAHKSSGGSTLGDSLRSAMTNPVEFARGRVTGGVGLLLRADSTTRLPLVQGVGVASPAESAGLRAGDLIVEVDGISTAGRTVAQVAQDIIGLTGGKVALTIRRSGTTNFQCVIPRSSFNTLRGMTYKQ